MKNRVPRLFALALLASLANPVQAQVIDTGPQTSTFTSTFGTTVATYGQTFTALTGYNRLDQFTFQARSANNGGNLNFRAYLFAWDGEKAVGNALFTSDLRAGTWETAYTTFTFNTGGVGVVAGQKYVAFINASQQAGSNGTATMFMGSNLSNAYDGGTAVSLSNGSDFSAVTQTPWIVTTFADLAFTASFSNAVVPEPSSAVLVIAGLAALGLSAYRRRVA